MDNLIISFEDNDLCVINKPSNLSVHRGIATDKKERVLVDFLVDHFGENGLCTNRANKDLQGIVHRLDKDTSGLMLVAKNNQAYEFLTKQITSKTCQREYLAICHGVFVPDSGEMIDYLVPDKKNFKRYNVAKNEKEGKLAMAHYTTEEVFCSGKFSLIKVKLQTGRTHQIRVQCESKNHPILFDNLYKNGTRYFFKHEGAQRQMLHSSVLRFNTLQGEEILIQAPPPSDMQSILGVLRESF